MNSSEMLAWYPCFKCRITGNILSVRWQVKIPLKCTMGAIFFHPHRTFMERFRYFQWHLPWSMVHFWPCHSLQSKSSISWLRSAVPLSETLKPKLLYRSCPCNEVYYKSIWIKNISQMVKNTFLNVGLPVRCERIDICCGQKEWPTSWLGILTKPWVAADPILCSVLRVKHWAFHNETLLRAWNNNWSYLLIFVSLVRFLLILVDWYHCVVCSFVKPFFFPSWRCTITGDVH